MMHDGLEWSTLYWTMAGVFIWDGVHYQCLLVLARKCPKISDLLDPFLPLRSQSQPNCFQSISTHQVLASCLHLAAVIPQLAYQSQLPCATLIVHAKSNSFNMYNPISKSME
ncbi:hypothetical protein BDV18DRAFT_140139 [Aspergillus unguis]